jgi:putative colanic acid biosynthesis acetyltransferase WcaF
MLDQAPAYSLPTPDLGPTRAFAAPSFSFGNRFTRFVWGVVYLLFFRFTPRPMHAWRASVLRCFGAKLGRGCHIYPRVEIWAPWNLECEEEVGVADRVILYNQAPIRLGRRAVISQGSHLCTGTHDYNLESFPVKAFPIVVRAHAWICAEAFVHPGVTIGEGAVIGARAVVTRDMPEWTVCAGHPCVPLKPRRRIS